MRAGATPTLLAALLLLTPAGCGVEAEAGPASEGGGGSERVVAAPPGLDVPGGKLELGVGAGTELAVPGSDGGVMLEVGAIESGRARVTLARADGSLWVKLKPMKPGDALGFDFDGVDYSLTLTGLRHDGHVPMADFTIEPRADG